MGFVRKPLLTELFSSKAFGLKAGEVSQPVETAYDVHLIVAEKISPPGFQLVRKSIEFAIARERLNAIAVQGGVMNADCFKK
jgi:parvulin-like peptidyl-prolyl isomerase